MKVHVFIAFFPSAVLHKARTPPFDLNAASSLLLDMLDIRASMPNNLSTKIEAWDWFKVNWDFLLWPFTLSFTLVHY
jgi:hypothetical protein